MAELGRTSGVKAQNAEYFAADVSIPEQLRGEAITVYCSQLADSLEYTLDSGSTWYNIKGSALGAATPETFIIYMNGDDNLNFRCPDVGGTTINIIQVIN